MGVEKDGIIRWGAIMAVLFGMALLQEKGWAEAVTAADTIYRMQAVDYTYPSVEIHQSARAFAEAAKEAAGEDEDPEEQQLLTGIVDGSFVEYFYVPMNGRDRFVAKVASVSSGRIEVRRENKDGDLLGTVDVPATGGFDDWKTVSGAIAPVEDEAAICLVFKGAGDEQLFVMDWIGFQMSEEALARRQIAHEDPVVRAAGFTQKSDGPALVFDQGEFSDVISKTTDGDWLRFENVDFGEGMQSATVRFRCKQGEGGWIALRLGAPDGKLLGKTMLNPLRGNVFNNKTFGIEETRGKHDLYVVFLDDLYEADLIAELQRITFSPEPFTRSGNPIITHMRTADPSARVWPDDPDTIWIYPSHDPPGQEFYRTMDGYHAFSSTNLIDWTDHGEVLHSRDVPWGVEEGGWMWAPDAAYRNGKYYIFFPHRTPERHPFSWRIGVAMSDQPQGPFTNATMVTVKDGPERHGSVHGIDPAVLMDDDGAYYLYFGKIGAGRLTECMTMVTDRTSIEVTGWEHPAAARAFSEGPYMHKHDGKYYLSWTWLRGPGYKAYYAMGDHPLGPFEYMGPFNKAPAGAQNHHSVVTFQGKSYFFYHVGGPGPISSNRRMVCVNRLEYNEDGTIKMVEMDWEGVEGLGARLPSGHGIRD